MESWGGGTCLILWMHFAESWVWDLRLCLARKVTKDGKNRCGKD